MMSWAAETAFPSRLVATHLMAPESLNLAPFKMTAPPSSSSFISMRSHEKISTSSLYHWMLGFGVPRTRTRNSIYNAFNQAMKQLDRELDNFAGARMIFSCSTGYLEQQFSFDAWFR